MMRKILCLALVALPLSACMHNPLPQGYAGPVAHIADSVQPGDGSSENFFYVSRVNGEKIDNSLADTVQANSGMGFSMKPIVDTRGVPASPSTFTIIGRTHYAAPILELANTVYQVSGDVQFTPAPNKNYVVKGLLGADYSAVWVEDSETGAVAGHKIEVHGSAKLGILEK